MDFKILTLFPEFIEQGLHTSILGKASEKGLLSFEAINIRDYSTDKNNRVDDYTYGGGAGMLMQAQPIFDAYMSKCIKKDGRKPRTIYVTPQGRPFSQVIANELASEEELVFICGHYEGIDERVLEEIVTDRFSIGDYVLTGGELPSLVMIDAISRLVPGVLGNDMSAEVESFFGNLLEYPQYTRPEVWRGKSVPEELLTGNPKEIEKWRHEKSVELTKRVRPDIYDKYLLKERALKSLKKDKRNNIHLIEALNRGIGDVVCENPLIVYLPYPKIAYIEMDSMLAGDKLLSLLPKETETVIVDDEFSEELILSGFFIEPCRVNNAVYTEKVHKKIKNKNIRQLDLGYSEYVSNHYLHAGRGYVEDRINRGLMYGIFVDDKIIGFIGVHCEGSIGMLYVDEDFRGNGYAADLENYMINKALEAGQTPYGQIIVGNTASLKLQQKNGLYLGNRVKTWLEVKR